MPTATIPRGDGQIAESLRIRNLTIDCRDPYALVVFWARVTGFVEDPHNRNEPGDPEGLLVSPDGSFNLLFVGVEDPPGEKRGRRLDLAPVGRTQDEEVDRILRIGATVVSDHRSDHGHGLVVLADPEGNLFAVEPTAVEPRATQSGGNPAGGVIAPVATARSVPRRTSTGGGAVLAARVGRFMRREVVARLGQLVRLALLVIELFIAVRVILKVAGANEKAGFDSFVDKVTSPFVAPFHPVFADQTVNGHPFEVGSLLAMAVYLGLALLVVRVAKLLFAPYR